MNGYLEALKKHNIHPDNSLVLSCDRDQVKNNDLIRKLLKGKNRPDCIFASVEKLALTVYEICKELKLNIPNDIKIITFSNSHTAGLLNPSLTTITQPAYEMGREAASILFKIIDKSDHLFFPELTVINSQLIKRASTNGNHSNQ
eukprot:Opistho-2@84510